MKWYNDTEGLIAALQTAVFGTILCGQFSACSTDLLQMPTGEKMVEGMFNGSESF